MRLISLVFLTALLMSGKAAVAQQMASTNKLVPQAQAAWKQFQQQYGSGWQISVEPNTGYVRNVLGKSIAPGKPLHSEADFVSQARKIITAHAALFGVTATHLQQKKFVKIDLARFGSATKYSVQFKQNYQFIPVEDSSFVLLFTEDGRCVDMSSHIIPNVENVNLHQVFESADAQSMAREEFYARYQIEVERQSIPQLMIIATQVNGKQVPRLAWLVECRSNYLFQAEPLGLEFAFAADNAEKELLRVRNLVHRSDLIGKITGKATPGTAPDTYRNLPVEMPLENITVTSESGAQVNTNAAGDFVFPGVSQPANLSAVLTSPYVYVNHYSGPDSLVKGLFAPDQTQTLTFNAVPAEFPTAEVNAYYWITRLRNWYLSINPYFDPLDFQVTAEVNDSLSSCDAYFLGDRVHFVRDAYGCVNSAYSSVIVHEMGHWINVIEDSGNGTDGFGEGSADTWAMYILDSPIVGESFLGPSSYLRSGYNARLFCGDNNRGCYGNVHDDGEVLMGALWKVREEFKFSFTETFAVDYTNALLIAWYIGYDDYRIHSEIRDHWLILSDDDADLSNGTPYCAQIDLGFKEQGFPAAGYCSLPADPLFIYVDAKNSSGYEDGSLAFPFNTILEGINAAAIGGNVLIINGTYNGNLIKNINKSVTLHAVNGSVTIQ